MAVLEELKRLSDERFQEIYEALSEHGFGPLDGEVAEALKFRPQAIKKLPMSKRSRRARLLIQHNTELCYEIFGTFLVKHRKDLVTGFLDETGVKHEDGMIEDVDQNLPDPARIPAAVTKLDASFDPEDVTLYLALCAEQWPEVEELAGAWRSRAPQTA